MTDNEIIKALELCSADECWCDDCPYKNLCTDTDITKFALDLINRQKSEIERLEDLNKCYYTSCQQIAKSNHEIKAEAVKEFAERLKETGARNSAGLIVFVESNIDNLVKEMVGENNG